MVKIWALSDGRAGIERQAQAFANALSEDIENAEVETVRINPHGLQVMLPPQYWFNPLSALPSQEQAIFYNPPDILVANGRRSIPYSLLLKKRLGDKITTIQLQDPKVACDKFDFVIAPKHDEVKGKNVYETLGGVVYYSDDAIKNARSKFNKTSETAIVILGGNSKTHKFTLQRASEIIKKLDKIKAYSLCITTSRRTPEDVTKLFEEFAKTNGHNFYSPNMGGENPYLSWLSSADIAFITEDSANMLADAAFFGLPINILKLEGSAHKFDILHESFVSSGMAKYFKGEIFDGFDGKFNPNPLQNSIKTIAKDIAQHWQSKQK